MARFLAPLRDHGVATPAQLADCTPNFVYSSGVLPRGHLRSEAESLLRAIKHAADNKTSAATVDPADAAEPRQGNTGIIARRWEGRDVSQLRPLSKAAAASAASANAADAATSTAPTDAVAPRREKIEVYSRRGGDL